MQAGESKSHGGPQPSSHRGRNSALNAKTNPGPPLQSPAVKPMKINGWKKRTGKKKNMNPHFLLESMDLKPAKLLWKVTVCPGLCLSDREGRDWPGRGPALSRGGPGRGECWPCVWGSLQGMWLGARPHMQGLL